MSSPPQAPPTIYHLGEKPLWEAAVAEQHDYFTESLAREGFTHATDSAARILPIGNAFYTGTPGDFVVLVIETAKLEAEVKMEKADAPLPGSDDPEPPTCPHIFGKVPQAAVTAVHAVVREAPGAGRFLSVDGL